MPYRRVGTGRTMPRQRRFRRRHLDRAPRPGIRRPAPRPGRIRSPRRRAGGARGQDCVQLTDVLVRAPPQERHVRAGHRLQTSSLGPRADNRQGAASRRQASIATRGVWGRGPTRSGNLSASHGDCHRDDKRLYLQEDTRRSTRDCSIGGSAPQHIASWLHSCRPCRRWPIPLGERGQTGAAAGCA